MRRQGVIGSLLGFVKDWNFVIPVILWTGRELYGRARLRRRRVKVLGFRAKDRVQVLRDEETSYRGHLSGFVGSVAVARAGQRLKDMLKEVGLSAVDVEAKDFDPQWSGNLALLGTLRGGQRSLTLSLLARLGYSVQMSGDSTSFNGIQIGPRLRLGNGSIEVTLDHSVIVRGVNPNNSDRHILLVLSMTADGVERAVQALNNPRIAQLLAERVNAACIIEADVRAGSLSGRYAN